MDLFAGVEDAQSEDGEAVDDETGGFGVEWGRGVLRGKVGDEPLIHFFDEVVASLVVAIDGMFDLGDGSVGGLGIAGLVLLVPEIEVLAVLGGDQGQEGIGFIWVDGRRVMPGFRQVLLQTGYGRRWGP